MPVILNIDTALEEAQLSVAEDGKILASVTNNSQADHAAWIQPAIKQLMDKAGLRITTLDAVASSIGPGSYTGLRVGLATAKGICYAANLPLAVVNSLEILALPALQHDCDLICPMIDARRMEVFAAVYRKNLEEVMPPHACILKPYSYEELLGGYKILFLGNGSDKFRGLCNNSNAYFKNLPLNANSLALLSYKKFIGSNFVDVAYVEPLYVKEFFTTQGSPPDN